MGGHRIKIVYLALARGPWGASLKAFIDNERGVMAVVLSLFTVLIMGMSVLALDVGRMVILTLQMQNAADAAVLAAAVKLDGTIGSRTKAEAVARSAALQSTNMLDVTTKLTVNEVNFYRTWGPDAADRLPAIDDQDAVIAEVVMNNQSLSLFMKPLLEMMVGRGKGKVTAHSGRAVARNATVGCDLPTPIIMCNPYEVVSTVCGGHTDNLFETDQIGRQVIITEAAGGVPGAPGEYGLTALSDGTTNATDLGAAIASTNVTDCQGLDVTLVPGVKTSAIVSGFNSRLDAGSDYANDPAPHVGDFPRDGNAGAAGVIVGNGEWGPASYLVSNYGHPLTVSEPAGDVHTPTRYQVYLWQIGVEFQMNGQVTVFPPRSTSDLPNIGGTWTTVNAGGSVDVVPPTNIRRRAKTPSSLTGDEERWVKRRLTRAAVMDCTCLGITASSTVQPSGRWMDLFITEKISDPGGVGTTLYAEIVGAPTTVIGDKDDVVRNVQLID